MKQSLMRNVIEFACSGTGTLTSPATAVLYPCGEYITGIFIKAGSVKFMFRLTQDGKQIFPVRTNLPSGYYATSNVGASDIYAKVDGLWIPVNPNQVMTIEFCYNDGAAATGMVTLVMASEDERSVLVEAIQQGFGKLFAKETKTK